MLSYHVISTCLLHLLHADFIRTGCSALVVQSVRDISHPLQHDTLQQIEGLESVVARSLST